MTRFARLLVLLGAVIILLGLGVLVSLATDRGAAVWVGVAVVWGVGMVVTGVRWPRKDRY